ncbi:hypothetical protein SAMN04487845_1038 [Methylobacterium sp. yr668]|nr:hypothetical protein SAMN04487845_1038 [Methylobacterium sp. yr668]
MPSASLMDQIANASPGRTRMRPHPALVVAAVTLAIGLWFVIYAVAGRAIWFW